MISRERQQIDLEQAFFPVIEEPINVDVFMGRPKRIPGYKALVEQETGRVISVVSSKYRLLLNREAYELADIIIQAVFEGKRLYDFECFNILMPKTKGSCRIDLILPNDFNELFGDESESWTPFIRISNSYNRRMTLKYEIGFCRWICKNGVIFGQLGISFSVNHTELTKVNINKLIGKAKKEIGGIVSLWSEFEKKMNALKEISLPVSACLPIYCKAFDINVKDKLTEDQEDILCLKAKQIIDTGKEYFEELGNNGYAMMNVLSDYASFPRWSSSPNNFVDGYQRTVGRWVDDFLAESKQHGFSLSKYIGEEYQNTAYTLESLVDRSNSENVIMI